MATFTITTATNIDALSGKTGADTYNVNGAVLTVDQDSRHGLNNDTSSIMGATTLSATLGGSLVVDGRKIRLIPYDGGSGNVPAYNTTISGAAGSGLLIGVYDTLTSAPTTPGSAMPADGYIKIKQWNDGAFVDNEALTGLTANVTTDPVFGGTDRVGWLEYVQQESTNFTLSRLNNPTQNLTYGDWLKIGITDGTRSTTYQIPTNGVNQYHGGVWVEGQASTSITGITYDTSYKTFNVTATSHGLESGDKVVIAGVTPSGYNGTYICKKVDANTVRIFLETNPGTYTSGGTIAGDWEFYPNTSDDMTSANLETNALKGKYCKISTGGLVRFGHDGTNSSGGYCPPSGRNIRMGNVFMTGATSAAKTQNSYNATAATRPRFITSGAARVVCEYASWNWGFGSMTTVSALQMTNCGFIEGMTIATPASAPTFVNCGFGTFTAAASTRLLVSNASAGVILTDCVVSLAGQAAVSNVYPFNPTDCLDIVATRTKFIFSGPRGANSHFALQLTRSNRITLTQCIFQAVVSTTSSNLEVKGGYFYDSANTKNVAANALYAFNLSVLASTADIEGIFIDSGDLPRNGLISTATSTADVTVKNIGRLDEVVGSGKYEESGAAWTRVTTTATVTTASPHGYTTGDIITVWMSDVVAAIPRAEYTITVTGASTFTFTCTNSGATSGVLSFYYAQMTRLFLTATSTSNLKLQNVHLGPSRTSQYGLENSSGNVTIENCTTTYYDDSADVISGNDLHFRGSSLSSLTNVAQSSVYGTHLVSGYIAPIGVVGGTAKSWTRSASTITVTHTDHGMYTGMRVQVLYSSDWDATAASSGVGAQVISVLTKNTFTITGTNAGSASGTLDYITPDGMMMLLMNEPTTASDAQFNVVAGTPLFTGAGTLTMPTVGDTVEFVTETWITDFDSIPNMLPYTTGSPDPKNFKITYSIDTGSGYSAFKNYAYYRAGSGGSSATTTVTMTDTTGVAVGDYVYGEGIASGAKVVSIDSGTNITVSIANTSAIVNTGLWFNQAPNEAALPTTGFKMKVRVETMTTNTDALTFIRLPFVSDATSRAILYPQAVDTVSLTITGLPTGTTVALYDSTDVELQRNDNILTGEFSYEYVHSGTDIADVYYVIWHEDYIPVKSDPFDLTATDLGLSYTPQDDTVYDAAYDDRYTIDYANKRIIMGTGENTYDVRGAYSKWKADIFNADNFTYDFAFSVIGNVVYNSPKRIPPFTELTNSWKIRPREADHTLTVENGILYATSGADPFVDTTGAYTVRIMYSQPVEVLTVSTGSAVTPGDITDIADAVWDEALSGHTTAGTAGKIQNDLDLTNVLAKDALS